MESLKLLTMACSAFYSITLLHSFDKFMPFSKKIDFGGVLSSSKKTQSSFQDYESKFLITKKLSHSLFSPNSIYLGKREWQRKKRSEIRTAAMSSPSTTNNSSEMSDSGLMFRWVLTFIFFFAAIAFPCMVIYQAAYSSEIHSTNLIHPSSYQITTSSSSSYKESPEIILKRILKEASMDDKTIILTTLNEAWAVQDSIIDLFLESFRIGEQTRKLLNHLVIVAFDQTAYTRCLGVHAHCFALTTSGLDFSKEAYFMTPDYLKMMWRRIDFLRSILEMGYNFVFTDADIMWFRNPFPRFYPDADFQIACDNFIGNSNDLNNRPNGGFTYVKSSNRTIEFYKYWYSSRETYPEYHDQDVLNKIKYDSFISEVGLKIRFLDTAYFGGLCEPSRNLNLVCTMHVNCCYGLDSKLIDLRIMLDDWRRFMTLSPNVKRSWLSSWRVPHNCSLSSRRHFSPPPPEALDQEEKH